MLIPKVWSIHPSMLLLCACTIDDLLIQKMNIVVIWILSNALHCNIHVMNLKRSLKMLSGNSYHKKPVSNKSWHVFLLKKNLLKSIDSLGIAYYYTWCSPGDPPLHIWCSRRTKSCRHPFPKPEPLVTTNTLPSFPGLVTEDTSGVTSWAEACCLCPATPHEPGSTSCWCWLVALSTGFSPNPQSLLHFRQTKTNDEELLYPS